MPLPVVGLIVYPNFSSFHFSVPYMIFNITVADERLFDIKIIAADNQLQKSEGAMLVQPDGDWSLLEHVDIAIIPGWHALDTQPDPELTKALHLAHRRGTHIVGLCLGTYALAYAGLLDGKKAATHWIAEHDFSIRFPNVKLDMNALYVEDDRLITSAGTGAGLDCCLSIVRQYHGAKIANKVARLMVIPPHREGGQAQYIEQPVARSTQDNQINQLLDYLRQNLAQSHSIDILAKKVLMSRRTFTRHFRKATGMTIVEWLIHERLQRSKDLLETSALSIEKIAELIGFQTATSFRQHFKQRYQISPSTWRKMFCEK